MKSCVDNFCPTPFNYTGSKFKLLGQLLPHFDYSKKIFIDLFCGGGSVYCNVLGKYEVIVINDIIKDLIDIHKDLIYNLSFVDEVKLLCPTKDDPLTYGKLRDDYNLNPTSAKLFALMLSCTNNMMRFNKKFKFNQTFGKRSFNDNTQKKIDNFVSHIKSLNDKSKSIIYYLSSEFDKVSDNELKDSFYYIDPPYSGKVNNDAGYNCYWNKNADKRLFDFCLKIHKSGATFCLSNIFNENKDFNADVINNLIDYGFSVIKLDHNYNKVSKNKNKIKMEEIIIKNY